MIDFLKYRHLCLTVSFLVLIAGIWGYFNNGGFSYSIDFTGGTELRLAFDSPVDIGVLRESIASAGWSESSVQNMHGDKSFVVKLADDSAGVADRFLAMAKKAFPESAAKIESVDHVGPEAGAEVRWNAIYSILIVLLSLLIYISLRHKYAYAIGAVVALVHDLLVLWAFYLVFKESISLNILAAVLSVLGYSLNDTIVVFSRIKENLSLVRNMSQYDIVNLSLNQTLSRTILTSLTTFMSMLALFLFGGDILRSFAMTMMVAIVFGTYSSIYIASPVMMYFNSGKEL